MYHVQRLQSFLMANDHVIFVPEGKCNIDIIMPITDPKEKTRQGGCSLNLCYSISHK